MSNLSNLIYWIWLTTRKGVGATTALRLLDVFVTPQRVYYGEDSEYDGVEGMTPFLKKSLGDKSLDQANEILGHCDELNIQIMTIQDADYPERLRQIDDPPPILYFKGRRIRFDEQVAIGMVGAREATDYGRLTASKLGLEIARGGGLVVSGIAQGVDSAAILGALKGGGQVVSVLAGGIDKIFPYESRFLYQDVAAVGMLLSEYPPGTPHMGAHFPVRNRIISGLSLGVIAVECQVQSGTMITVRRALDQNRDVFAVPGNIDAPMSRGPNALIRDGARLVTCGEDVLEEYRSIYPTRIPETDPLEAEVLEARLADLADSAQSGEGREVSAQADSPDQPDQTNTQKPREKKARATQRKTDDSQTNSPREFVPAAIQRDRFTDDELAILRSLGAGSHSPDELVEQTQIPTRRILSALTMLQVRGQVGEQPGKRFESLVELEQI